jgi:hypothetical protein
MRCEADTGISRRCNAAFIRFSVAGLANENNSEIAAASAPLGCTCSTSDSSSASVGERRMAPSAFTRSGTLKRKSRGTMHRGTGVNQS